MFGFMGGAATTTLPTSFDNNDLVDGWEREGEDEGFFRQYSERSSYPMGINIITYAMTH